jgi:AraC-like DNA-binding protein
MIYSFADNKLESILNLVMDEESFCKKTCGLADSLLTIAWNRGSDQTVVIDDLSYDFPSNTVLPLMAYNTFEFSNPIDIVAWQFNKAFYCIVDHDKEVSCAGFLFYGSQDFLFIKLDDKHHRKMDLLVQMFEDEFTEEDDSIQGEMLRILLKRLIILTTRLGKQQYVSEELSNEDSDVVRSFNLLVEQKFREFHQVQDYASMLNRSPKSLSNLFARQNNESPLQVIKNRIILEAKRLLKYSSKTSKEIAFELGFEEPASFSRFFKNQVGESPSAFQKA